MHPELVGHPGDRASPLTCLLTQLKDHPDRTFTQLGGVFPRGCHSPSPFQVSGPPPNPGRSTGYTGGELLVLSRTAYGVELFGSAREDCSWQAKAGEGFDTSGFTIDWDARTVTCPQGNTSTNWAPWRTKAGEDAIHVDFSKTDCTPCPARSKCTRAKREPRQLTLHTREVHQALHRARAAQHTESWKRQYALRSGIEGTISQAIRGFQLQRSRYLGLAKTHLQHVLTAVAINLVRVDAWLAGTPLAATRSRHFHRLQAAAAT
ncbi:transposase [Spirillospora sp. CA-255316]